MTAVLPRTPDLRPLLAALAALVVLSAVSGCAGGVPYGRRTLLASDFRDGGVYRSDNSGATWQKVQTTGLRSDRLWTIAADHLADSGITLSNGRIAPYWKELIQENRSGLRSGNPDLIFPGETVTLPPIS